MRSQGKPEGEVEEAAPGEEFPTMLVVAGVIAAIAIIAGVAYRKS